MRQVIKELCPKIDHPSLSCEGAIYNIILTFAYLLVKHPFSW
jgi:hypothetical protein